MAKLFDIKCPKHGVYITEAKNILDRVGFRGGLTREQHFALGLHKQNGTQQRLWHNIIDYMRYLTHVKKPR